MKGQTVANLFNSGKLSNCRVACQYGSRRHGTVTGMRLERSGLYLLIRWDNTGETQWRNSETVDAIKEARYLVEQTVIVGPYEITKRKLITKTSVVI